MQDFLLAPRGIGRVYGHICPPAHRHADHDSDRAPATFHSQSDQPPGERSQRYSGAFRFCEQGHIGNLYVTIDYGHRITVPRHGPPQPGYERSVRAGALRSVHKRYQSVMMRLTSGACVSVIITICSAATKAIRVLRETAAHLATSCWAAPSSVSIRFTAVARNRGTWFSTMLWFMS